MTVKLSPVLFLCVQAALVLAACGECHSAPATTRAVMVRVPIQPQDLRSAVPPAYSANEVARQLREWVGSQVQSVTSAEDFNGVVLAARYVSRSSGARDEDVQRAVAEEVSLLHKLDYWHAGNPTGKPPEELSVVHRLYSTHERVRSRLVAIRSCPPEVALFGEGARTMWNRIQAARALFPASCTVTDAEIAAERAKNRKEMMPELSDDELRLGILFDKAHRRISEYVRELIVRGDIQFESDDFKKQVLDVLAKGL